MCDRSRFHLTELCLLKKFCKFFFPCISVNNVMDWAGASQKGFYDIWRAFIDLIIIAKVILYSCNS